MTGRRGGACAAPRSASCSAAPPPSWPSGGAAIVAALGEFVELEIVNGGGTGSLELTGAEEAVTEVTAGSGFYAPALFDHYSRFTLTPAAGFALPIVRKPRPRSRPRSAAATSPPAPATQGASRLPGCPRAWSSTPRRAPARSRPPWSATPPRT